MSWLDFVTTYGDASYSFKDDPENDIFCARFRLCLYTMSLATYANRLNIRLLKTADFNEQLRKRGCKRNITTQSICKTAKDEKEVREILEAVWRKPVDAEGILKRILHKNEETYRFERMLNEENKKPSPPPTVQS